jgi:hypothetical protein
VERRLFDFRMADGSRNFADLPESYSVDVPQWERLRDHVAGLAGAELTGFVTDQVTEAWIDFTYAAQSFSINNQSGEWWFFVADPACPDAVLHAVIDHFATLLEPAVG